MSALPTKQLPPPSAEKKVSYTVWMDPVLLKALKHEAIDRDMTVPEIIEEALRTRAVPLGPPERPTVTEHK